MARPHRIGILTGGGDVPGLNSVIKSVVYRSSELGYEVIGLRRGWQALTHMQPGPEPDLDYVRPLDRANTRTIDRTGGTWLHSSRTNPKKMRTAALPDFVSAERLAALATGEGIYDFTPLVLDNLGRLGIDTLIAIGGDDTLSYAKVLADAGVQIIAIPKTMDNDVKGTEYCIGFSTAITRAKDAINRQRTTLGSHERIGVFRIFGRNAGFTALYTAYVTSARCVIPEQRFDIQHLTDVLVEDRRANPSRYSFVIASEGALPEGMELQEVGDADAYGHRHKASIGEVLAAEIRRRTGIETVDSELTYDLRSGDPDALDQMVGITFANVAMELVVDGKSGQMTAIRDGRYSYCPIPEPGARTVDVARFYNAERYRPVYTDKIGLSIMLTQPVA
ncbi:MAG: 6-phosphofructokinase [Chloroflexi bacterium]|nr:6-phosphofructokinase [Chloroflexota bacterium]